MLHFSPEAEEDWYYPVYLELSVHQYIASSFHFQAQASRFQNIISPTFFCLRFSSTQFHKLQL